MCADEEGQEMLAGSTSQLEGRWESADVGQGTGPEPGPGACIQERTCHTRVSKAAPSSTRLCSGTGALGAVPAPHSLWAPSCGGCVCPAHPHLQGLAASLPPPSSSIQMFKVRGADGEGAVNHPTSAPSMTAELGTRPCACTDRYHLHGNKCSSPQKSERYLCLQRRFGFHR